MGNSGSCGEARGLLLSARAVIGVVVLASVIAASGCKGSSTGASGLHARQVVLLREVQGLREVVSRLERKEPMLPRGDASISISDNLVREMIAAQLPVEVDVGRFHVRLESVEVVFRGSTVVRLLGTLRLRRPPVLKAQVDVIGALEGIAVDSSAAMLSARVAIDHLSIERAAGLGSLLSRSALNKIGRSVRLRIEGRLPQVQIPIRVQQTIDFPAVTSGSVKVEGASLPLRVTVSQVMATKGRLWVALHFEPGKMIKTTDAPAAADATAAETGFGFDLNGRDSSGKAPTNPPGKGN